jgi:hypothetical protein
MPFGGKYMKRDFGKRLKILNRKKESGQLKGKFKKSVKMHRAA